MHHHNPFSWSIRQSSLFKNLYKITLGTFKLTIKALNLMHIFMEVSIEKTQNTPALSSISDNNQQDNFVPVRII